MINKCLKPFTYSATQWAAIRRELPSLPATSSGQHWSTIGARRIPAIVGGGEAAPIYPAVVCAMILITTGFCTYLLIKFRPYNSVPALS